MRETVTTADCDSRRIRAGALFVALKGDAVDGHLFVADAVRRGAQVVVAERVVDVPDGVGLFVVEDGRVAAATIAAALNDHPSEKLKMIAVTGTAGKTTTTLLIRHILNSCGIPCAALTTISYYTAPQPHPSHNTTPGPFRLHALLREALQNRYRACVMEVSSHAICQKRVLGIDFRCAVLTNIASDHLDYHKTHASYRAAKRRLFETLPSYAFAVLNADDDWFCEFRHASAAKVLSYGLSGGEIRGRLLSSDLDGILIEVEGCGRVDRVKVRLVGRHNAYNVLAALGAALSVGVEFEEAVSALGSFAGVPGRLERVGIGRPAVFVDFAHTEGALRAVLSALRPLVKGRLVVVFGCGGDRDRTKRGRMGVVAESLADVVVVTSDNPRSEKPEAIIAEILDGMRHPERAVVEPDRRSAILKALSLARPDDVVVVAGKGHERVQIVGNRLIPFDDREVVREALERLDSLKRGRWVA